MDTMTLIAETLAPAAGKRVLDVGCGSGFLAKGLMAQGARVDGIDPAAKAIETARTTEPAATFHVGPAEALPFADHVFDAVIFLNSLHHVDAAAMAPALGEAARVVRTDGLVIVIEPLAAGSFFSAMLPIDDETAVRGLAQDAVRKSLADGVFERVREVEYVRRERFADLEHFLIRTSAADPSRAGTIAANRAEVEAAFHQHAQPGPDGRYGLDQPLRADILRPAVKVQRPV